VQSHDAKPDDIALSTLISYYGQGAPTVYPILKKYWKKQMLAKRSSPSPRRLGMAGQEMWTLWRSESAFWIRRYFKGLRPTFVPKVESCYRHFRDQEVQATGNRVFQKGATAKCMHEITLDAMTYLEATINVECPASDM